VIFWDFVLTLDPTEQQLISVLLLFFLPFLWAQICILFHCYFSYVKFILFIVSLHVAFHFCK
jgi:hypothetical protein